MPFIILLIYVVDGLIWGLISHKVAENRGYYDASSFWWGFFLSWIGLIVVFSRPARGSQQYAGSPYAYSQNNSWTCKDCGTTNSLSNTCVSCGSRKPSSANAGADGWRCQCGIVNAPYVGTCRCGRPRQLVKTELEKGEQEKSGTTGTTKFEEVKAYKDLLDSGVITQEEFDKKKSELLGI